MTFLGASPRVRPGQCILLFVRRRRGGGSIRATDRVSQSVGEREEQ